MQALCAACNLSKGAEMLRRHQRDFKAVFEDVLPGRPEGRMILLAVTPGGGKSAIPVIAAAVGVPRIASKICIVTPRQSLQAQVEDAFLDPMFRRILGHEHRVRIGTNQEDPSRGLTGYVTTYQALIEDRHRVNALEFGHHPYILVLDEIHHIEEGGEYHRAVEPLVERAAAVVLMTGTLERSNGKRIAYVPYRRSIEGKTVIHRPDESPIPFVSYSRRDALDERAVILLDFQHLDGDASWIDRDGQMVAPLPISLAGKRTADAIFTSLRTEFARDLLDRCVRDWTAWKRRKPRSKLLAVAPNIKLAKQYLRWLTEMGVRADIATTDDEAGAKRAIEAFRLRDLDALMTVGMAYEGLDCPAITHVACLTHIRSRPWIQQLISRANRFDRQAGGWEGQRGFIYAPDDQEIVAIFEEIRWDQEPYIRDESDQPSDGAGGSSGEPEYIVPIESRGTRVRAGSLDGETLGYDETAALLGVLQEMGYEGVMSPTDLLAAHRKLQHLAAVGPGPTAYDTPPETRPSTEEDRLLSEIESYCRGWDRENGSPFGTLNKIVFQNFGKSRKQMSIPELREVWAWLNRAHPRRQGA